MLKKKRKKTGYYLGKNYLGIKVLGTKKQDGDLGTDEAVRVQQIVIVPS